GGAIAQGISRDQGGWHSERSLAGDDDVERRNRDGRPQGRTAGDRAGRIRADAAPAPRPRPVAHPAGHPERERDRAQPGHHGRLVPQRRCRAGPARQDHHEPPAVAAAAGCRGLGITVATPWQASVALDWEIPRVLLANALVQPAALTVLAPSAGRLTVWSDSSRGVEIMHEALTAAGAQEQLSVIVELGAQDGRTGVRTLEDGLEIARTISAS